MKQKDKKSPAASPRRGKDAPQAPRKRRVWHAIGQWLLWILTLATITGLVAASFAGNFNPHNVGWSSLAVLSLPAWILAWLVVTVLDLLWCRKALVFCILAFIACANAIWDYCPLNLFGPSEKKYAECPKFTLLTYNVASFHNQNDEYPGDVNPTVSYLIRKNADVVCLQETEVSLDWPFERYHITRAQVDTINQMYPYRLLYGQFLKVMSKYPIEAIHTPPLTQDTKHKWTIYPIGVFRLNIEGMPVTLFNVHLQSYGLSDSDKEVFAEMTEGKELGSEDQMKWWIKTAYYQLYRKVRIAGVRRANEADALCRYIEKFGGPNVIIAGDFNDVSGCYTMRRLADFDMRQVYPELGFGPLVTFNADRFYFHIDHVLYRGGLVPLKITKSDIRSSDHYPLEVTFAIVNKE